MRLTHLMILSLMTLCACGAPTPVEPQPVLLREALAQGKVQMVRQMEAALARGEEIVVADAGQGKKTPASLSLKIDYSGGHDKSFSTKASVNGSAPKVAADVQSFQVWLIDTASAIPTGALTAVAGPFTITYTGSPQTLFLDNVPPSANQYFVAVAARDNTNANISKAGGTTIGGQNVAVSSGGGSGSGSVVVNAAYQVSSPNPLTVAVQLKDGIGATIEARATLSDGGAPPAVSAR